MNETPGRRDREKTSEAPARRITATHFVRYIDRTRDYYRAQGYPRPYRWPAFADVPFALPGKPLAQATATVITTANPWHAADSKSNGSRQRQVYSIDSASPPDRFYTDDLSWHKAATHTDDPGSFFPLEPLRNLVAQKRLGAVARRCHGVPTRYSQSKTANEDAPEILERCRDDGVDVAFLVPL